MSIKLIIVLLINFSHTSTPLLDSTQSNKDITITRLADLCKIGGVIQMYYANDNLKFQKEYLEAISLINNENLSQEKFENIIDHLLIYGDSSTRKKPSASIPFDSLLEVNYNFTWLFKITFDNDKLIQKAERLIANIRPLANEIKFQEYYGIFKDKIEFDSNNINHNLFLLFSYWNIINYHYYYKQLVIKDWIELLDIFIGKNLNAKNSLEYQLLFKELTAQIRDSHTFTGGGLLDSYFGTSLPGFSLQKIDDRFFVSKIFDSSIMDLSVGDEVIKLNGQKIDSLYNTKLKYVLASNETATMFYRLFHLLLGKSNDPLELVLSNERKIRCQLRYPIYSIYGLNSDPTLPIWRVIEKTNFGYIDLGRLKRVQVSRAIRSIKSTDGLILDLRNHPNNTWKKIVSKLSTNRKPFAQVLSPDLKFPGKFKYVNKNGGIKYAGKYRKQIPYNKPICVLINESTISHGEYSAMALSTIPNIKFIGNQSAGSDGGQVYLRFPNKIYTSVTLGSFVLYPNSTHIQGKGVNIDIEVLPNVKSLVDGDPIFKMALEFLKKPL